MLGIIGSSGDLTERYEYTPYGQRTVYFSAGVNDPLCNAPTLISRRWEVAGVAQPYGLNDIGHQGMMHDEEGSGGGLVYNRFRMRDPGSGRWMQRDPLGYIDAMSLYQYVKSSPLVLMDYNGRQTFGPGGNPGYGNIFPGGVWKPRDDTIWIRFMKWEWSATGRQWKENTLDNVPDLDTLTTEGTTCWRATENHVKRKYVRSYTKRGEWSEDFGIVSFSFELRNDTDPRTYDNTMKMVAGTATRSRDIIWVYKVDYYICNCVKGKWDWRKYTTVEEEFVVNKEIQEWGWKKVRDHVYNREDDDQGRYPGFQ